MEERKDHERARGALDELLKKKGEHILDLQGEVSAWQKELRDLRKECNQAKTKNEAKLKDLRDTSRIVIEKLTKKVEKLSSERDDLKNDAERNGVLKQRKEKEFEGLKSQVYNSSIARYITSSIYHLGKTRY